MRRRWFWRNDAAPAEPALRLTLFQCTLKADKFEWILQKGTELGVARFVPVVSARSVVRPAAALLPKYERWRAIVREAAEQSGRTRLPELATPVEFSEALRSSAQLRLLPWEEAEVDRAEGLGQAVSAASPSDAALLVGPEGGLTAEEVMAAQAAGWRTVTLGARTLRAETAALAAIAVIMDRQGELEARSHGDTGGFQHGEPSLSPDLTRFPDMLYFTMKNIVRDRPRTKASDELR